MQIDDTITAIATPIGEGGLAIIRMSGRDSVRIAREIFRPLRNDRTNAADDFPFEAYRACFGRIYDNGQCLDEVVLTTFRSPHSYTGEDTIEISCHGGYLVARKILTATMKHGARMAGPGEFTKRAFLNGKLDLTQAEAVAELISANSEISLQASIRQLQGSLKAVAERLRGELLECLGSLEALLDFPDEDIPPETMDDVGSTIMKITSSLQDMLSIAGFTRSARDGFKVTIAGSPNVGKSSLLNALLARERAIVSETPGTTRDTIEELVTIKGLPFRLVDTAGLRTTSDALEQEGVKRTQKAVSESDIIIIVFEATRPPTRSEWEFLRCFPQEKRMLVVNKADLDVQVDRSALGIYSPIFLSARTGEGLNLLRDELVERVSTGIESSGGLAYLINARHEEAIRRSVSSLADARLALANEAPLELVSADLRAATNALGEIIGSTTTDDILDVIFSKFCIGK